MARAEDHRRSIQDRQDITFPDAPKGRPWSIVRAIFCWDLFSPSRKGVTTWKLRIGGSFEENPKRLRKKIRSGASVPQPFSLPDSREQRGDCSGPRGIRSNSPHAGHAKKVGADFGFLLVCASIAFLCASCGTSGTATTKTSSTITVTITPTTASVGLGGTVQFTCEESGSSNTNITWEVNDVVGGNKTYGTITSKGLYTAPDQFVTPTTVTVSCIAQANSTSTANVPVTLDSGVSISVSPANVNLGFSQTQQFTATVTGSSNTKVTWQAGGVNGGNSTYGTIDSSGLYTAPSSATTTPLAVAVSAVAQVDESKSGSASVVVHGAIAVTVAPNPVTVAPFATQQFTATVAGTSSKGVTWEVNGVVSGSSTTGTISTSGLYTAPNSVPTTSSGGKSVATTVTVTAVSQADSTAQGNVAVKIQPPNQAQQKTPIPLGVSGGNANDAGTSSGSSICCGGTLGGLVARGGNQYILSASHVLARSDAGGIGDAIIQPGLVDSGCSSTSATTIANLSQFVNLESPSATTPFVDAALAQVISGQVDSSGTILQLGGAAENGEPTDAPPHAGTGVGPSVGLEVAKSGRSTGLTCSSITAIEAVVNLQYQKACGTGTSFSATFNDLVIVSGESFSADGDSGSLLVTQSTADPVALLVASSDTETVAAPVSDVLAALSDSTSGEQPTFVGTSSTHSVAGCSLRGPQAASVAVKLTSVPTERLQAAASTRDAYVSALLGYPSVRAVGIGPSLDQPGEAAILLVVSTGESPARLPPQVGGQRTRIIQTNDFPHEGALTQAESAAVLQATSSSNGDVRGLSKDEVARARKVQSAYASELMKEEGIQGVAITSSADNPSEAALLVLLVRGSKNETIPLVLDGVRTRIRESNLFQPGAGSAIINAGCRVQARSRTAKLAK
jgi:hypothetical protein